MHSNRLKRRKFISLLGGAAVPLLFSATAWGQGERTRVIGVLTHLPESNPEMQAYLRVLRQELD